MAKKRQEDNRDIFDKALDYAGPTVAGAVIGGAAGRFARRIPKSKIKALEKERMEQSLRYLEGKPGSGRRVMQAADEIADLKGARSAGTAFGATVGGATGAYYGFAKEKLKSERRRK